MVDAEKPGLAKVYFDVPKPLARAAKVEAARQGIPLKQIVIEALSQLVAEGPAWRDFLSKLEVSDGSEYRGEFPRRFRKVA